MFFLGYLFIGCMITAAVKSKSENTAGCVAKVIWSKWNIFQELPVPSRLRRRTGLCPSGRWSSAARVSLALMVKQDSWPQEVTVTHTPSLLPLGNSLVQILIVAYFEYSERESGSSASACWRLKDKREKISTAGIEESHDPNPCSSALCALWLSVGSHILCCSSVDPGGASQTRCDCHEMGDLGYGVSPLQRPGCVRQEEGAAVCWRSVGCKSAKEAWKSF